MQLRQAADGRTDRHGNCCCAPARGWRETGPAKGKVNIKRNGHLRFTTCSSDIFAPDLLSPCNREVGCKGKKN